MNIAESGFKFFQLLQEGVPLREAAMRSAFATKNEFEGLLPAAATKIELALRDAGGTMLEISKRCTAEFADMFDDSSWPVAAEAVRHAITRSKWGSYQYYYLVGLALLGRNHRLKFCECCRWRLKTRRNGRYCPKCSTATDGPHAARTTQLRRQGNIHAVVKHSKEYESFMNLRHLGEDYPLLMLVRNRYERSDPVAGDDLDVTPDLEYRNAKIALANLWDSFNPDIRARRGAGTNARLLELALKGLSRSEAAAALGMSRSGVTKACQRDSTLADAFISGQSRS